MADIKAAVQSQFDRTAENYRTSQVHAAGADLERIAQMAREQPVGRALDAGCGAGHTAAAIAPFVGEVVAYDLTPGMLSQVQVLAAERGLTNVTTQQGDVEDLPFDDATFDLVVTRYSAHHWPNPQQALRECARVLKPQGRLILSDIVAPDDPAADTFLQTLELLRDPSHVRDHSIAQWQTMFHEASLEVQVVTTWMLKLDFVSWTARMQTPPLPVQMLHQLFVGASSEIRATFQIQGNDDFSIPGALLVGVKPSA